MIRLRLLLPIIAVVLGLFGTAAQAATVSVITQLEGNPGAVYMAQARRQGNPVSDAQLQDYRAQLAAEQDQLLNQLSNQDIPFEVNGVDVETPDGSTVRIDFRYTLVYNGISMQVPESAIANIEAVDGVKAVHYTQVLWPVLNESVDYIHAPEVYGAVEELTKFDEFNEGFEGQGVYVSIIDTGIDWPHEMFGFDATPPRLGVMPASASIPRHEKVIYWLPLLDLVVDGFGHGTHVASTAAGYLGFAPGSDGTPLTADDIPVHGVAPQANIMSYKVCSDVGSTIGALGLPTPIACRGDIIIFALEDSVSPRTVNGFPKPVAHVINMSLGGGGGPDNPISIASDNAVKAGAIVVASAGNSGPGLGTVGNPAAGRRVIAVAANTDPGSASAWSTDVLDPEAVDRDSTGAVVPASELPAASGERQKMRLFPMAGTPSPPQGSMAQYYVYVTNGATPAGYPPNVSGRIALADTQISATFAQVANSAAAAGAVAVLLIGDTENPTAVRATIPAAIIKPEDSNYLLGLISGDSNTPPASGALSNHPIRLNPFLQTDFVGRTAGFSSRGPVQGFGQVKPDVSAPGVNVLAAVPPASLLGALAQSNYSAISGTSMSSPHVAGSVALVKQAHPGWTPDRVRTVMINTATNMRDAVGTPVPPAQAESIHAQGGGLIDVFEAVNAEALMGVTGDGSPEPTILGSHSFGVEPIINSRCVSTHNVTVTMSDIATQHAGTYSLQAVPNRNTAAAGVTLSVNPAMVTVPAGGTVTFDAQLAFDGDVIRDDSEPMELLWYVTATQADGNERLRMPFYLRAVGALPQGITETTETFTGIVPVGDANNQTAEGVTYVDVEFEVAAETLFIDALLEFAEVAESGFPDLDFLLFGPSGDQIGGSLNPGGPEHINLRVSEAGTYTYRVLGFANAATQFTITSTQVKGTVTAPTLNPIEAEYVNEQGEHVDFDGNFTVTWTVTDQALGFEVERSLNGGPFELVASVDGSTTSASFTNQPNGEYAFRVRGVYPGTVCKFVTNPSNVQAVVVDHRTQVDITAETKSSISNVSFQDGVFEFDLRLTNQSDVGYVPLVEFNVVNIDSASGTVEVINADNGGSGTSPDDPALFDYSGQLGDEVFAPAETTGPRHLKFRDEQAELFTFDAVVTAYERTGAASGSTAGGSPAPGDNGSGGQSTQLLRFTVNPLTGAVSVDLVDILL